MERKPIRPFEDLIVWQKAIDFVKEVYIVTNQSRQSKARLWIARSDAPRISFNPYQYRGRI